jgi:hypothetical protein
MSKDKPLFPQSHPTFNISYDKDLILVVRRPLKLNDVWKWDILRHDIAIKAGTAASLEQAKIDAKAYVGKFLDEIESKTASPAMLPEPPSPLPPKEEKKMAGKKVNKTTMTDFATIIDSLRNHREVITRECHSVAEVHRWVKAKLTNLNGCTYDAMLQAVAYVKLQLQPAPKATPRQLSSYQQARRKSDIIVISALLELYERLGEEAPEDLFALGERFRASLNEEEEEEEEDEDDSAETPPADVIPAGGTPIELFQPLVAKLVVPPPPNLQQPAKPSYAPGRTPGGKK